MTASKPSASASVPEVVNIHAAETRLLDLLERVAAGEEFVLAKSGEPYARLMPLQVAPLQDAPAQREFGFLAGKIQLSDEENAELMRPLSEEELADWE